MWVLVIFDPETDDVEVRGPWGNLEEAKGAAASYEESAKILGDDRKIPLAIAPVQPMAYFKPK